MLREISKWQGRTANSGRERQKIVMDGDDSLIGQNR